MSALVVASNVAQTARLGRWSTHFGREDSKLRDELIEMVQDVRGPETRVAIRVVSELPFLPVEELETEEPDE